MGLNAHTGYLTTKQVIPMVLTQDELKQVKQYLNKKEKKKKVIEVDEDEPTEG